MGVVIPKVFHRIWLGGDPMPEEFIAWGESWRRFHPGWAMKLWTEDNLPTPRHWRLLKRCAHRSQQSDIYRYEIGLREGGVYIDTDFECLRNIEPLIDGLESFTSYCVDDSTCDHSIACGFFGTVPNHPLYADLVTDIPNAAVGQSQALGPPFYTKHVRRHPEVKVFERRFFYPYGWHELHRRGEPFPESYAAHHWAGMWFPKSFEPLARASTELFWNL